MTHDTPPQNWSDEDPNLCLSLLMPVYNRAADISKAIDSYLEQADDRIELIIIDGGSTDGTSDICRRYGQKIRYYNFGPDKGTGEATNRAFMLSRGRYVGFLYSDDWLADDYVKTILNNCQSHTDVDIFSYRARCWKHSEQGVSPAFDTEPQDTLVGYRSLLRHKVIPFAKLVRRSLLKQIGLLVELDSKGEALIPNDFLMYLQIIKLNPVVHESSYVAYHFLYHDESLSGQLGPAGIYRIYRQELECLDAEAVPSKWYRRILQDRLAKAFLIGVKTRNLSDYYSIFGEWHRRMKWRMPLAMSRVLLERLSNRFRVKRQPKFNESLSR